MLDLSINFNIIIINSTPLKFKINPVTKLNFTLVRETRVKKTSYNVLNVAIILCFLIIISQAKNISILYAITKL